MSTYARIVDGFAVDIVVEPPLLAERFNPDWMAAQTFIVVPDGTIHGASDNGDGTFTNPPPATPPDVISVSDPIADLSDQIQALSDAIAAAVPAAAQAIASAKNQLAT